MPSKSRATQLDSVTLAMSGDSSDDDFQNPTQVISLTQNLIFSSFQNRTSQPLKLSNSAAPLKKPKSAPTGRKNNSKIPKNPKGPELDVGISSECSADRRKPDDYPSLRPLRPLNAAGAPKKSKPAASVGKENCGVMETQKDPVVGFEIATEPSKETGNGSRNQHFMNTIKAEVLESSMSCSSAIGNVGLLKKPKLGDAGTADNCEITKSPDVDFGVSIGGNGETGFKWKSGHYSNSIESRLLEPMVENDGLGGDSIGDFEPGTQLNDLMNLCSDMGEEENPNGGVFTEGDIGTNNFTMRSSVVECPLCGADISDLSEESRQLHTNDCLDRDEISKIIIPSDSVGPDSPQQQVVDVSPVLEWLRNLGLSKYEDAFVKEEIDWDTLQWLSEEDLLSIGITALGPRKKIVHALKELKRNIHGHESNMDTSRTRTSENKSLFLPGNKLITQFFEGPSAVDRNRNSGPPKSQHRVERSNNDSGRKRATVRRRASSGRLRDIPPWCCIPGTPFRVDAFRYLRGDCSHWFLSHFHTDHYQGLTRGFCRGKIYCSSITACLVNMKIGVPWDRLQVLPLNEKINIAGVNVTCLDANHCPGSVIILFEPPNSKVVLHTGDFRFTEEMTRIPVFQSCSIHTLILDTTYCNPQYDFPKQEAVIQFVVDAIQAEAFNPKTLFLIGSYTIDRQRETVFGSCSMPAKEDICWRSKITAAPMPGPS
ncbi:uncharacterized protein LOC131227689 isoform X2 [Magnolia sinica]|uniref:uncharacterized protein LOC131227689 isoform X2 n=1 Tax=Magnolia sinica TaxID=86752 RepID=UPI0026584756|nr:uncharacterized protein LOC131227689 isoform X2 [Magnolia sinica]